MPVADERRQMAGGRELDAPGRQVRDTDDDGSEVAIGGEVEFLGA